MTESSGLNFGGSDSSEGQGEDQEVPYNKTKTLNFFVKTRVQ